MRVPNPFKRNKPVAAGTMLPDCDHFGRPRRHRGGPKNRSRFVIAMGLETTEEELMHTVFPHPTLSEMMHESVLDAYGRVIHM